MANPIIPSQLLENDPEMIELIDRFISRLPDMGEDINNAYNTEQWGIFSELVHQMKGIGGGYGYPMLTELCAIIEITIKQADFSRIKIHLDELNSFIEQIIAASDENHNIVNKQ